jgi:hypothetical protein
MSIISSLPLARSRFSNLCLMSVRSNLAYINLSRCPSPLLSSSHQIPYSLSKSSRRAFYVSLLPLSKTNNRIQQCLSSSSALNLFPKCSIVATHVSLCSLSSSYRNTHDEHPMICRSSRKSNIRYTENIPTYSSMCVLLAPGLQSQNSGRPSMYVDLCVGAVDWKINMPASMSCCLAWTPKKAIDVVGWRLGHSGR